MLHIKAEMGDLQKIQESLGIVKDKSKMILRTAINNAAKELEKRMVAGAKADYRYREKQNIKKANSTKKATVNNLEATITVKGKRNLLYKFDVKPKTYFRGGKGAPKWVRARVKSSSPYKNIALFPTTPRDKYKGFVNQVGTGEPPHVGIFVRNPKKKMRNSFHKEAIRELTTLDIPSMENASFRRHIGDKAYEILADCIEKQLVRHLNR